MIQYQNLHEIQEALRSGEASCVSLVQTYLQNIREHATLNAFLEVYEDDALGRAAAIDERLRTSKAGKLAGMVVGIKDVLCLRDKQITCGSKILEGFESQFTATAVQRLLDEDAIIIGRQNCDEFAMGSSSENSAYGVVRNGKGDNHVPGGSSGGSAVAVQMDMCLISLGSDTGGSVRQPASFCGVLGLKPTYSRISRYGLAAYASSFDVIGIFGKSVADVALSLEVMAGPDEFDSTVSRQPVPAYADLLDLSGKKKIAYIADTLVAPGLQQEVKVQMESVIDFLKEEGHTVESVDFPLLDYVLPTYYILTTAEASSNLSRYDGVRYGYRSPQVANLEEMYKKSRSEGFGEEVRRRILLGTFVLSASYYDAYYTQAQKARRLIREKTHELLADYDMIILPTSPTTAFELGSHTTNPLEMYTADLFTVQASVAGIPAVSIPLGEDDAGMPIGLQVMGHDFCEADLLAFASYMLDNYRVTTAQPA